MTKYLVMIGIVLVSSMGYAITAMSKTTNAQYGNVVLAPKTNGGSNHAVVLPNDLSVKQNQILKSAYEIAKKDGNPYPEKFQAIIMTETLACDNNSYKVAGKIEKYYGCGQVKLNTAKAVLQKHPELRSYLQTSSDDEIVANLILNDEFNLKIASKYFMMTNSGKVDDFAIAAYNQGPSGAKKVNTRTFIYTKKVKENEKRVKRISQR